MSFSIQCAVLRAKTSNKTKKMKEAEGKNAFAEKVKSFIVLFVYLAQKVGAIGVKMLSLCAYDEASSC